jgi:hypothetical protein
MEHQKVNIPKIEKPQKWASPKQIALVAVFAALYYALSLIIIPQFPTTAGPITISLNALIASVFGLVLGPYLGGAAALLGSTVTWALTGMSPMGLPFIIAPMFNALVVGFVFYRKWKYAFIVFAAMVVGFLFTPAVSPLNGTSTIIGFNLPISNAYLALLVLFDKVIALLLILPLAFFGKKISMGYGAAFFFILAFIGNQADNMWGSFIFSFPAVYNGIFNMQLADVHLSFIASPFLYPAIRLIQAAIVTVIAVPLMRALSGTNWLWRKETVLTGIKQAKAETVQTDSTPK